MWCLILFLAFGYACGGAMVLVGDDFVSEELFSIVPEAIETSSETNGQVGEDFSSIAPNDKETARENANREGESIILKTEQSWEASGKTNHAEGEDGSFIAPMASEMAGFSQSAPEEEKGDCNYAKGRWVADNRRPLYPGFACKRWLSDMWACRLTQRPDFSYERYRWEPENCKTPEFDRHKFLRRMQDKTIALVGDSLGRQQFQSLMCMVTGGEDSPEVEDIGRTYGLVRARGSIRPDGWAFRFPETNTTILYYWSASLCELEPLNPSNRATEYAMHLDRPATFLRRYLDRFDVLVLNTGHHWNRGKMNANRWVMYVDGKPNTNRKIAAIGNAKNLTIYSVVGWLDSQLPKHPRLKAFLRTISPRHFVNGEWNTGGSCNNSIPLAAGSEVTKDESSDPIAAGAVKGTRVKLLDITALSQLRDECHISKYSIKASEGVHDCLHWCLPGVPDTWNEILAAQL
ncbi:Protein trichome birefringence-like 16 [Asimina triloba]